jgi:hypothetical protein
VSSWLINWTKITCNIPRLRSQMGNTLPPTSTSHEKCNEWSKKAIFSFFFFSRSWWWRLFFFPSFLILNQKPLPYLELSET